MSSTKQVKALERELVRRLSSQDTIIAAQTAQINDLEDRMEKMVADIANSGDATREPATTPAKAKVKIPARPPLMKEAGIGRDPE